jgi:hypothetical protein
MNQECMKSVEFMLSFCIPFAVDAVISATGYTKIVAHFRNICKIDK